MPIAAKRWLVSLALAGGLVGFGTGAALAATHSTSTSSQTKSSGSQSKSSGSQTNLSTTASTTRPAHPHNCP